MAQQTREPRKPRGLLRATDEEWKAICDLAKEAGRPTMSWVREHCTGAPPAQASRRRARRIGSRLHQLSRILNNLRQLGRIAQEDGDDLAAERLATIAADVEAVAMARPDPRAAEPAAVAALVAAGVQLNTLAHRANSHEELPPAAELDDAVAAVLAAIRLEAAP
ncbi:MAG: hypothetical protein JWM27_3097 [Gemmatimonadetes bacterium]|nr:hypothetical protein [Gemmatimonadota bacterium]